MAMNTGKEKCDLLKKIRLQIAEEYGLSYCPTECTHEGDCLGTCPKCDAELADLQKQLDDKGKSEIDINDVFVAALKDFGLDDTSDLIAMEEGMVAMGEPFPPFAKFRKKRTLYKECQIAGITFHDLSDIWDELYVGAELALIRQRDNEHDQYAIAVALADDYGDDPDDFDFDLILGYVPRTENEELAKMMDMGWDEAFECELSQVEGSNPYKGSLYMRIYVVSKDKDESVIDTSNLLRVLELNEEEHEDFIDSLNSRGCYYARYGGFPPWERTLPEKGDKVVFLHRAGNNAQLYLMHCIAVGDYDAAYFVEDKGHLHAVDDCCFYVFTLVKGSIFVKKDMIEFLRGERINDYQPEDFLSEVASLELRNLFERFN